MGIFNCRNMKKKIAILGSTGSIGKNTFNIVRKNSKDFESAIKYLEIQVNLCRLYHNRQFFQNTLLFYKEDLISFQNYDLEY